MAGRPPKLNDLVRKKIEEVAALDGTVEEMAYYCDVSRQTIYQWLKDDPEFSDKVERLRQRPILKARQTINKHMGDNYQNAIDYLKRKKKKEFGDSMEHIAKLAPPTEAEREEADNVLFAYLNK